MEFNGFADYVLRFFLGFTGCYYARQIRNVRAPSRGGLFEDDHIFHRFRPACFKKLFKVPGGRSSLGSARQRYTTGFDWMLILTMTASRCLQEPTVPLQQLDDIANLPRVPATFGRLSLRPPSWQSEGNQRIALWFFVNFGVTTCGDHQILFAAGVQLIGHGGGVAAGGKLRLPKFFACFYVEGADVRGKSAGNENQSSRSNDGTAQAQVTPGDGGMARGEILEGAKRKLPPDRALDHVDCG